MLFGEGWVFAPPPPTFLIDHFLFCNFHSLQLLFQSQFEWEVCFRSRSTNHGSKNFAFILALKGEFRSILLDVVSVDQNLTRGFFPSYFHFLNGALLWDSTRALKRLPAAPCNVPTVARNVYLLVYNRCITNAIALLGHRNFVSSQQKMKYRI